MGALGLFVRFRFMGRPHRVRRALLDVDRLAVDEDIAVGRAKLGVQAVPVRHARVLCRRVVVASRNFADVESPVSVGVDLLKDLLRLLIRDLLTLPGETGSLGVEMSRVPDNSGG